MVNTTIHLIVFFVVKDGNALYSQQKKDLILTMAQIMNSLLQNSGLNGRKQGNHWAIQIPYDDAKAETPVLWLPHAKS